MGKKKNIKSIAVKSKASKTEAIDILKSSLEKQLENSIEKSKERFIFNERKIENLDSRITMLSDEIVNLTNDIQAIRRCVEKDFDYISGLSDKIDAIDISKSIEFKTPEITIDGKTFDICLGVEDEKDEKNGHTDNVNHPSHYTDGKYEVINFIHDYMLWFDDGNAVKYICRAGKKDEDCYLEDLKKAEWYLYSWYEFTMEINDYRAFGEYRLKKLKKDRINVADFCRDKKLGFDLTKVINFIVLGRPYDAYLCLHSYVGYLEELGHEA